MNNDEEGDRSEAKPPSTGFDPTDPEALTSPELQEIIIDALADVLHLTIDDVHLARMDHRKYWEIAQAELPSLEDVEEVLAAVQNRVFQRVTQSGWLQPSDAPTFTILLYCELFPAVEMGDSLCRETRLPVAVYE